MRFFILNFSNNHVSLFFKWKIEAEEFRSGLSTKAREFRGRVEGSYYPNKANVSGSAESRSFK